VTPVHPTMLWESTDAHVALWQRFQFASAEHAIHWLMKTVARSYALSVESVDRFVISSSNLLAWLTTADGPLIAKCCAVTSAHDWLSNVAELVVWLDQHHLPVSAPLRTRTGQRQVLCDHLTLGLQRVIPGQLLDPTQLVQARTAGTILARLHTALAAYPRATDFTALSPLPSLDAVINEWIEKNSARLSDPALVAGSRALVQQVRTRPLPKLAIQLVHGDFRAANILWHAEKIAAVLDFEELRWGYSVNDLAWAAVHLGTRFRQWGAVSAEVHAAFVAGYESIHRLIGAERAWLPALMTWHSIALAISATGGPTHTACIDSVRTYTRLLSVRWPTC
jgi:homoserine kinase type II